MTHIKPIMSSVPPSPPTPPLPPPPSPSQLPSAHPHQSNRMEIKTFVDNLSEKIDRRDLLSIFSAFGHVYDVFIPRKRSRSGSKFDFVRFDSEDAAGRAVFNVDGLKLMDRVLHVKRVAFGKEVSDLHSRKVGLPPILRHKVRSRDLPSGRRGSQDASSDQ
ncbi:Serine arginine-rich splicing factor 2 [Dionaea muscipula]